MSGASMYAHSQPSAPQPRNKTPEVPKVSQNSSPFSEALLKAPAHPTLKEPVLHVTGLSESSITDQEVMRALVHCLRARPKLERGPDGIKGVIEFEHLLNAEKAFATVQNVPIQKSHLSLAIRDPELSAEDSPDPESQQPQVKSRLVKQLPNQWTAAHIFELFRVFGPVHRVAIQLDPSKAHFTGLALVDFYQEAHAAQAALELHFSEQEDQTISVQTYDSSKGPIRGLTTTMAQWVHAPEFYPASAKMHQPDLALQNVQYYGPEAPYAVPQAYGPTLSPAPLSPAAASVWAMPPSFQDYATVTQAQSMALTNPGSTVPADPCNLFLKNLDPKISSQDIFQAFKCFGHIVSARVMRDEVTGQSKEFGFVSFSRAEDAAAAKDAMDGQPLKGVHGASSAVVVRFHEPKRLREQKIRDKSNGPRARQADFDQESVLKADAARRLSGVAPPGSPPMPSSPQPRSRTLATEPESRRSSERSASPAAVPAAGPFTSQSERERLLQAVARLGVSNAEEVVGLLQTLSKKERALCLFNTDVLRSKVTDAQSVLEASDSDSEETHHISSKLQNITLQNGQLPTPQSTPERRAAKSSREAAVVATGVPKQPAADLMSTTDLAKLPAVRIIELASSEAPSPLMASPPTEVVQEIDRFVDGLVMKPVNEQKQKLGERLFKKIKELGFKGAPKLTIHLLDTEDLRALAHLMAEQPEILKEKVALIQLK